MFRLPDHRSVHQRLICFGGLILWMASSGVEAKNYPQARALAPMLKPLGLTAKAEPKELGRVRDQAIRILNVLEQNAISNGPEPKALLDMAFEFQPAVGPAQKTAIIGTLDQMWREARALGLFDKDHKFAAVIQTGRSRGEQVVWEYIVPLSKAPRFSRDLSNLRLVAPASQRVSDADLTPRDAAYAAQLEAIGREIAGMASLKKIDEGPKLNALGQTDKQVEALWKAEVEAAGESFNELPGIRITPRLKEGPSHDNGFRWCMQVEVVNVSRHPTEVEVSAAMLGMTQLKRVHYLMASESKKLKLRKGQSDSLVFWMKGKGHYKSRADDLDGLGPKDPKRRQTDVDYRGAVIQVLHGKGLAASWASDATLQHYLNDAYEESLGSLPNLQVDPPKKK